MERRGIEFNAKVIVGERIPDYSLYYQYLIGLAYLAIGLFVYFRRGNAPKSLHFLLLCLVSFVLSTFHYTGKLNNFDKVIYWGNIAAGIFAPTIFLHFCLTFPEPRGWLRGRGRVPLIYLPGTVLLAITVASAAGNLRVDVSPVELRWLLDRRCWATSASCICSARVVLNHGVSADGRSHPSPAVEVAAQRRGARHRAVHRGLCPAVRDGLPPAPYMKWAVLFLPLIPITWAYAIVRYRLMDVDVIFQQGYVYTLATIAVLGVFYALFLTIGKVSKISARGRSWR